MALSPPDAARLALWLTTARYLDPECCGSEDSAVQNKIAAARGIMQANAMAAAFWVNSTAEIAAYLNSTADKLAALASEGPPVSYLTSAERLLRELATCDHHCESGDGTAFGDSACDCGFLELASSIEQRVRDVLAENSCLALGPNPLIQYVTALTNDNYDFAPFRVNGSVNIRRSPRTVTVVLQADELTSRDLWHLAYTLHHELVCHAFQCVGSSRTPANAHPSCHWSEGWMDTVAFDLVTDWVEDGSRPSSWLPLSGDDARGELWKFHDKRYANPRGLEPDDFTRRRLARDTYRRLSKTLAECQMASTDEAALLARRFALAANVHPDADCHRLKFLSSKLRIALLSTARPTASIAAAAACLAFTADRDLDKLESALDPSISI